MPSTKMISPLRPLVMRQKGRLKNDFQTALSFAQALFFRQAQDGDDESAPNNDQCDKHHNNG